MELTKEMIITEFEYKRNEGNFTMFTVDNEILAIEHEGYDVSLMDLDDSEMTPVSDITVKTSDPEEYIDCHFKSK